MSFLQTPVLPKKKAKGKKCIRSFQPDHIVERLQRALERDLNDSLWDPNSHCCTNYGPVIEELAAKVQINEFTKKYKFSASHLKLLKKPVVDTKEVALDKFKSILLHMRDIDSDLSINLPDPNQRLSKDTSARDRHLLRARAFCHHILGSLDITEWFDACKNSSGSSVGVSFANTGLTKKFQLPVSATWRAAHLFNMYLHFDVQCYRAIEASLGGKNSRLYDIVKGSRLTTVEKNNSTDRVIAIEPTANMFLQQGLMALITDLLKPFLDIQELQDIHRRLMEEISITGLSGTIDFSSASDCVALILLKFLLPSDWYQALCWVRSETTTLNGETIDLPMFATMGNATTFPIETLVFFCLGVAVSAPYTSIYTLLPEWDEAHYGVSVYGDDCIIPVNACDEFIHLTTSVGFIVNIDKTHTGQHDPFRESCGADYYAGRNIRPFHIKAPHNTRKQSIEPWLYVIANRLLEKYISYFGDALWLHELVLFELLSELFLQYEIEIKVVPADYPDDSGFKANECLIELCSRYFHANKFSPVYFSPEAFPRKSVKVQKGNVKNWICDGMLYTPHNIDTSARGSWAFSYCKFNYKHKEEVPDDWKYWLALKFPKSTGVDVKEVNYYTRVIENNAIVISTATAWYDQRPSNVREMYETDKRIGGYVVSKGYTSFWEPCSIIQAQT